MKEFLIRFLRRTNLLAFAINTKHNLFHKGEPFVHDRKYLFESVLDECVDSVKSILKDKILIAGDMVGFDKGTCRYIRKLNEQSNNFEYILMSECISLSETETKKKINIPFFKVPEFLGKNYSFPYAVLVCPLKIKRFVEAKEYRRWCFKNLCEKEPTLNKNYAYLFTYYAEQYINKALDVVVPKKVIIWNEFYHFHHLLDNICKDRGIEVVYFEFGSLPGTFSLEKLGQMGECFPAIKTDEFIKLEVSNREIQEAEEVIQYLNESKENRKSQPTGGLDNVLNRLKPGRPTILYAGCNDYESGISPYTENTQKYHSPIFKHSEDAVPVLSTIAQKYDWNLIYKPHPIIARRSPSYEDPNVIYVNSVDINDIIDLSTVVVTILSQVSYISLIRNKPTVLLGYTQLKGKGCCYESYNMSDIDMCLKNAVENGFQLKMRNAFIKHIAQMNTYNLFDDLRGRTIRYGLPIEKAIEFIEGNELERVNIKFNSSLAQANAQPAGSPSNSHVTNAQPARSPSNSHVTNISKTTEGSDNPSTINVENLIRILGSYDVVSFDIFDTLVFRAISKPEDVFYLVGNKLNILNFKSIRIRAEKRARGNNFNKLGTREVNLIDIYKQLEKSLGIDAYSASKVELECEMQVCFANPYMQQVFEALKRLGKQIYLVSDMYLEKEDMICLLESCGFDVNENLFISCEYRANKRTGDLYDVVDAFIDNNSLSKIHVGDNKLSDIEQATNKGWDTFYYPNVNLMQKKSIFSGMSIIVQRLYEGITNTHLFNGIKNYNEYYKFGYLYGGLFVIGFCNYIHKYVQSNNVKKVVFVARDGDVIKQVYNEIFSNEKTDYMLCSRTSNLKLMAYKNKDEFFRQYIRRIAGEKTKVSIREAFVNMELEVLLFEKSLEINEDDLLTEENCMVIQGYLEENWELVLKVYNEKIRIAKKYYASFFEDCERAVVVDVGWSGSTVMTLRSLEEDFWHFNCEITGILGATGPEGINSGQLSSGILDAYMFSAIKNIELYKFHRKNPINNMIMELLLGSDNASLKGFTEDENGLLQIQYCREESENYYMIREIHKGIIDFALTFWRYYNETANTSAYISGNDAYVPIKNMLQDHQYVKSLFENYHFMDCVGEFKNLKTKTMSDAFEKFNF